MPDNLARQTLNDQERPHPDDDRHERDDYGGRSQWSVKLLIPARKAGADGVELPTLWVHGLYLVCRLASTRSEAMQIVRELAADDRNRVDLGRGAVFTVGPASVLSKPMMPGACTRRVARSWYELGSEDLL